jgi:hypothetical protein
MSSSRRIHSDRTACAATRSRQPVEASITAPAALRYFPNQFPHWTTILNEPSRPVVVLAVRVLPFLAFHRANCSFFFSNNSKFDGIAFVAVFRRREFIVGAFLRRPQPRLRASEVSQCRDYRKDLSQIIVVASPSPGRFQHESLPLWVALVCPNPTSWIVARRVEHVVPPCGRLLNQPVEPVVPPFG